MPARTHPAIQSKARTLPVLLDYEEVAEHLGVSYWTIRRMVKAGELRHVLVSKRSPRIDVEEVVRYVERRAGVRSSSPAASRTQRT